MTNLGEALVKRSNSVTSNDGRTHPPQVRRSHSNGTSQNGGHDADDGQLRYWTNEMCRKSPHLFDFVITVSVSRWPSGLVLLRLTMTRLA